MSVDHRLNVEYERATVHVSVYSDSDSLPPCSVALHKPGSYQSVYMQRDELIKLRDLITEVLNQEG